MCESIKEKHYVVLEESDLIKRNLLEIAPGIDGPHVWESQHASQALKLRKSCYTFACFFGLALKAQGYFVSNVNMVNDDLPEAFFPYPPHLHLGWSHCFVEPIGGRPPRVESPCLY